MGGPLVQATEQDYQLAPSYFNKIGNEAYWPQKMGMECALLVLYMQRCPCMRSIFFVEYS